MDLNTVSTVLQIVVTVTGILYILWDMRTRLALLSQGQTITRERLVEIDTELKALNRVAMQLAVQDERMRGYEIRLAEVGARFDEKISVLAESIQLVSSVGRTVAKAARKRN